MLRRHWIGLLMATAVFLLGLLGAVAQDQKPGKQEAILMRAKLAASQRVLEGLMAEDFELLESGARMLRDIENWPSPKRDAVYSHYSTEYRRLAEKLVHLAKEKNLEGVMFTYQHLNMTCVSCHQYVRGIPEIPPGKKI